MIRIGTPVIYPADEVVSDMGFDHAAWHQSKFNDDIVPLLKQAVQRAVEDAGGSDIGVEMFDSNRVVGVVFTKRGRRHSIKRSVNNSLIEDIFRLAHNGGT